MATAGDDFELFEGGISVRKPDGRFQPVTTPPGFTDLAFRNAVAAFDTAYRVQGRLPTVDMVHQVWPKIPKKTYSALYLTEEFKQALRYRGIEWDIDNGLSMEQSMVITKLSNPFDRRSISAKLRELGIPMPRYQNWLKQPLFYEALNKISVDAYREALPSIRNRLIGNAESGDQRAIELVFAITGEWDPNQRQLEDARTVVMSMVEAIIARVKDPEVRKQIFADVQGHAAILTMMSQSKALEG